MKFELTLKGKVKAKQSMKIGRYGKYIPHDVVEYSNYVKLSFMNKYPAWDIQAFLNKPLTMAIDVFMPVPNSFSKTKREQALRNEIRPVIKPDCDNIAKNINDALNGIAYPDDKQIVCLKVNKYYAANEYVTIEISDEIRKEY